MLWRDSVVWCMMSFEQWQVGIRGPSGGIRGDAEELPDYPEITLRHRKDQGRAQEVRPLHPGEIAVV